MESGPGGCLGRTRRYGAGRGCFDHKSVAKNMVLFMKFDVNCPDSRFEDFYCMVCVFVAMFDPLVARGGDKPLSSIMIFSVP